MTIHRMKNTATAVLTGVAMFGSLSAANAGVKDYEFQLVQSTAALGPKSEIAVRLINKVTGKPVPDAVIFATRLDMTPDGMAEMATSIAPAATTEPGIYKFVAKVSMQGRWQLSLAAKVQGESGTVENKLVIEATK